MITLDEATQIARQTVADSPDIEAVFDRELAAGWFFRYRSNALMAGSQGVIVNKTTGQTFTLGSAFPIERDLRAYAEGFQYKKCDLMISSVRRRRKTVRVLRDLAVSTVETEQEGGTAWRVPRELTRAEIAARLKDLPCVFENVHVYFHVELLQQARAKRYFEFELREEASATEM